MNRKIFTARAFFLRVLCLPALCLPWAPPVFADAHGHKKSGQTMQHETDKTMQGLVVMQAWARASAPNAQNGAAYVTIINHGMKAERLIGASGSIAAKMELHTHNNDGGVMRMRQIPSVNIPADGTTHLKPGGDHIMLMGLKKPLKAGEQITLTLTFESGLETRLKVMVMRKGPATKIKHSH